MDPERGERLQEIETFTRHAMTSGERAPGDPFIIPVVVHVVWRSSSQNISDEQIISQIRILNEDFSRSNSDADNYWDEAGPTEIQFCLASVDPAGNPTTGITRKKTKKRSFSYNNDGVKFSSSGGTNAWPASDYLNIWVCDLGSGLLGYAQFPGGDAATDGVVNDYAYFGDTGTATYPYDLGRTATHEVGHWLNLRHIWGDGPCGYDDFVGDTPESDASNGGCNVGHVSCGTEDMVQNYMDYSYDACMNLFTVGQADRMHALFGDGGSRASLLNSGGCGDGVTPDPELCYNGIDDDGDGFADCEDSDCDGDPNCTTGGTCVAPTSSSVNVARNRRRATISWSGGSGAIDYTLEYRQINTSNWSVKTTTGTSARASGLTPGETYEYQITANCSGGQSDTTDPETFTANRESARFAGVEDVLVYPNPASEFLTVEFNIENIEGEGANIHIHDIYGRLIKNMKVTTDMNYVDIDVSKLANAVYFLKFTDEEGQVVVTKKFLIAR